MRLPATLLALLLPLGIPAATLPAEVAEIRAALLVNDLDAATAQGPQDALTWMWAGRAYMRQTQAASMPGKAGKG